MDCERYQNWLSDAALGALDRSRESELRAHVEDCAGCRTALERERMLVAAIDRGVAAHLAAEPSANFAARLKARLAEEGAGRPAQAEAGPRSGWPWGFRPGLEQRWIPAAALALVAATIGLGWLVHHVAGVRGPAASAQQARQPALSATRPAPPPSPAHAAAGSATEVASLRQPARRGRATSARAVPSEVRSEGLPEVLIDQSEQEGIVRLCTAIQNGRVNLVSLMAVPPGFQRAADGSLVPALLKIEPLDQASGADSAAGSAEPGPSQ